MFPSGLARQPDNTEKPRGKPPLPPTASMP